MDSQHHKEGKDMTPATIAKIQEKKKQFTEKSKIEMIKAGGSVKTNFDTDSQEICREVKGK